MFQRSLVIATLAVAALALVSTFDGSDGAGAQRAPEVASAFGRAIVNGQEVYLHVTVASTTAADADAAAQAEVRRRGAIPIQSAEFSKNGTWNISPDASGDVVVELRYNPTGQQGTSYKNSPADSEWTAVPTSSFKFVWGANTSNCPSLVEECPGEQAFNGDNEAGWLALGGPAADGSITLGVAWYNFRTRGGPFARPQETDAVLNTDADWSVYDVLTVAGHELGHMAGLGHSGDPNALMYAWYQGARSPLLGQDDINGISSLYPATGEDPVEEPASPWCESHDPSHPAYSKKC